MAILQSWTPSGGWMMVLLDCDREGRPSIIIGRSPSDDGNTFCNYVCMRAGGERSHKVVYILLVSARIYCTGRRHQARRGSNGKLDGPGLHFHAVTCTALAPAAVPSSPANAMTALSAAPRVATAGIDGDDTAGAAVVGCGRTEMILHAPVVTFDCCRGAMCANCRSGTCRFVNGSTAASYTSRVKADVEV